MRAIYVTYLPNQISPCTSEMKWSGLVGSWDTQTHGLMNELSVHNAVAH